MAKMKKFSKENLLEVRNLKKYFPVREGILLRAKAQNKAVDDVSFTIAPGETLGLVGESGCGKSTLGKCVVRLYDATEGEIGFEGRDIAQLKPSKLKTTRQHMQMIFQDPVESLNSRHTVGEIIEEPLKVQGVGSAESRKTRVAELLEIVGLPERSATRYPLSFLEVSANASASPARSLSIQSSSCATSPCRLSTCPSKAKSSI